MLLLLAVGQRVSCVFLLSDKVSRVEMHAGKKIPAPEDVASPPSDAEVTPSGLASKVLRQEGDRKGERPLLYDTVTFDYTGWTTDG